VSALLALPDLPSVPQIDERQRDQRQHLRPDAPALQDEIDALDPVKDGAQHGRLL
jgi:hypothetical protein